MCTQPRRQRLFRSSPDPVIDRIAADVDELARARRVQDLDTATVLPDPPRAPAPSGQFRKLDAITVLTGSIVTGTQ